MTTLKEIRERLIDELQIGFYGTADSVAAGYVSWPLRFQNSNWGGNQFKNWWGHRPDRTGNDVVKAMTTLNATVPGALNHGASVYTDIGANKYFSLTRPDWHPTIYMLPLINRGLERAWQWYRTNLSLVPDGDMEDATAAAWTPVNATLVKANTGQMGKLALAVTNTAASGYAESQVFAVARDRSFRFTAKVIHPAGTTNRPRLEVWDKTNNVLIVGVTSLPAPGSWQDLQIEGTFPGTCALAAVRLVSGTGTTDVTSWDSVSGYWNLITRFALPSWVDGYRGEDGSESLRFYKYRNRLGTDGNWSAVAYDLMLLDPRDYQIVSQPSARWKLDVEFSRDVMIDGFPIIVEARRPFADFGILAAETDITDCPLNLAVAAAKVCAGEERRELNDRLAFWTHDFQREQKRVSSLLQVPALDQPAGMAFQVWTP